MTVPYLQRVANRSPVGSFMRVIFKWRGSIYKLLWLEIIFYLFIYSSINAAYRYILSPSQQRGLEFLQNSVFKFCEEIPMTFILGFYVSSVISRWWKQYNLLPSINSFAVMTCVAIPEESKRGMVARRIIVRTALLGVVLALRDISAPVRKRFPTLEHMFEAGYMTDWQMKQLQKMTLDPNIALYKLPFTWVSMFAKGAREVELIQSDHMVIAVVQEASSMSNQLSSLSGYHSTPLSLAYTHVVTLAVYIFCLSTLIGYQMTASLTTEDPTQNIHLLFMAVYLYFLYVGLLKVAEVLIAPFGADDDDFELNEFIDRNTASAATILEEANQPGERYLNYMFASLLPTDAGSATHRRSEPQGSAQFFTAPDTQAIYARTQESTRQLSRGEGYLFC